MSSPPKKKIKIPLSTQSHIKRSTDSVERFSKRMKTENLPDGDIQARRRKNFISACELVSYRAYFNQESRFQLIYLPTCAKNTTCSHQERQTISNLKPLAPHIEESFKIEMKAHVWQEALEVCILCISRDRYLSAEILKDIVEIMLNAHSDKYADFTIEYLINKCQETLELNFSYHPPCTIKSLRKCYNKFLLSPMDLKDNTFSNRSQYGYDKGVIKYCMNRLENEISLESKDEPLVDKYESIPEEMKQSVKGLHWQKDKLEIYELLIRSERIDRLMAVLGSIVELLQFDLAIWQTRYTSNLGCQIMRSHKPLMAFYLWSDNVLYTGAVNGNCRQIMRLFIYLIHLQYPEKYIKIMTLWMNTTIQTIYISENNSNKDYPNIGKYCKAFAKEFYKILNGIPQESTIKILERIKPDYMRYLIGTLHLKSLLSIQEEDPIRILSEFIKTSQWKQFRECDKEIIIFRTPEQIVKNVKNITKYLNKRCETLLKERKTKAEVTKVYNKLDLTSLNHLDDHVSLNDIIHVIYVTLEAYLDAYSVKDMQDTLDLLNEQLLDESEPNDNCHIDKKQYCDFAVTENFVKLYRSIYQALQELVKLLQELKNDGELPKSFKILERIGLLVV